MTVQPNDHKSYQMKLYFEFPSKDILVSCRQACLQLTSVLKQQLRLHNFNPTHTKTPDSEMPIYLRASWLDGWWEVFVHEDMLVLLCKSADNFNSSVRSISALTSGTIKSSKLLTSIYSVNTMAFVFSIQYTMIWIKFGCLYLDSISISPLNIFNWVCFPFLFKDIVLIATTEPVAFSEKLLLPRYGSL